MTNPSKEVHSCSMQSEEQRKDVRFEDIGRVDIPALCILPAILVDISMYGCKIRFPVALNIEMENEYDLKITPAMREFGSFHLVGEPAWIKKEQITTEVGFKILRSPGTRNLQNYVERLLQTAEMQMQDEDYTEVVTN